MENKCEQCGRRITFGVWKYSMRVFKKSLCVQCQKQERLRIHPKKFATFLNEQTEKHFNLTKNC